MTSTNKVKELEEIIKKSSKVLIIQADNPDGDSLGSALALEDILEDMGKKTHLYCGVDIPDYLKYFTGWDRVAKEIPTQFDAAIIVDTSALSLLEKLEKSEYRGWVASKPVIVIDHHAGVDCDIPYAKLVINDEKAVSTSEAIFKVAKQLKWEMNTQAKSNIMSSILSDSLGLSSESTTSDTYRIMAELIDDGVSRTQLEEARRELSKMPESIFKYKAELIKRTQFTDDGTVGYVTITNDELSTYSPLYNPAPLIQPDILQTQGVKVVVVFKQYNDGKITGSVRSNTGAGIANLVAEMYGGGGHSYAAGFKQTNCKDFDKLKIEFINEVLKLLDEHAK